MRSPFPQPVEGEGFPGTRAELGRLPQPSGGFGYSTKEIEVRQTQFGTNKVLYDVIENADRIEIHVQHENFSVLGLLRRHASDPEYFMFHYNTYLRSNIRALYWFGLIVSTYFQEFSRRSVDFFFSESE